MKDRIERIQIFEETMERCQNDPDLRQAVNASKAAQMIYWEETPLPFPKERPWLHTDLILSSDRSIRAAAKYARNNRGKVCVLNFASSVQPGGGVVNGSSAQEESICRITTLYPALSDTLTAGPFYAKHWELIRAQKMGRENRDDCIYTPGVIAFREDTTDCALLDKSLWFAVDILTCAAPDLRHAEKPFRPTEEELDALHEKRWTRILTVAAMHKAENVILGAFGCGAFHNPPKIVAKAASRVCRRFDGCFKTIEFAVYSSDPQSANFAAFSGIDGIRKIPE